MKRLLVVGGLMLGGCYVEPVPVRYVPPPPPRSVIVEPPPPAYNPPPPAYNPPPPAYDTSPPSYDTSVQVDWELPVGEPQVVGTEYLPPPMINEFPGPEPFYGAIWVPGFWHWD